MPVNFRQFDIIVSGEYYVTFLVSLKLLLTFNKARHITWGFNQSRRLLVFSFGLLNTLINFVFSRTDHITTFSRRESEIFSKIHNIKFEKFQFIYWSFDLPEVATLNPYTSEKKYVCMIGRNNRDWFTFADAVKLSNVEGIAVCAYPTEEEYNYMVDRGITIFKNLDMPNCLAIIRDSVANIILVNDNKRGAGHITAVASMLLKKPQIISDVDTIKDYFDDNQAFFTPLFDAKSVADYINLIESDPKLANEMGENGYKFAKENCSNAHFIDQFFSVLRQVYNSK